MENIRILYEDEYLVAFDKPSGLIVNSSDTTQERTLQDYVKEKYNKLFAGVSPKEDENAYYEGDFDEEFYPNEFSIRSGVVHRLDKDTSGVILTAKNENIFKNLQKQFKKRNIDKYYYALVIGQVEEKVIEINAPIGRNPNNPFKKAVTENGKDAVTFIETLKITDLKSEKVSLLKVNPKTGRTHQIRVHLSAVNHPVVYDEIYNTRKQLTWCSSYFTRLMLHAYRLELIHPYSKEKLLIESQIPEEFSRYF